MAPVLYAAAVQDNDGLLNHPVRDHLDGLAAIWPADGIEEYARTWLDKRVSWRSDMAFAERFAAGVPVDGAKPTDYLQRFINVGGATVLAGIRFRGEVVSEPFVDLDGWDRPFDLADAADVVRREWAVFSPKFYRVLRCGPAGLRGEVLDQSVHAARAADVARGKIDSTVRLINWDDPDAAASVVAEVYDGFGDDFKKDVVPASADVLKWCRDDGVLRRIEVDDEPAGVWATAPDAVDWLPGQVVVEECLLPAFRGRGLATTVQRLGAALLGPDDVMLGTVAASNHASRKTADRAGRREVMRYVMLPVDPAR